MSPVVSDGRRVTRSPTTLAGRASLNTLAAAVDMGTRFLIELLVTPILVSGLGGYLYGAWRVLWQWTGYLWATSGRSAQALQSAIANKQSSPDMHEKQQYVACALIVWLLFLPLLVVLGAIGVWYAPGFLDTPPGQVGGVRLGAAILVADAIALTVLTVPRSVLQAENMGYKRLGWSAVVLVVGAGFTVFAIKVDAGLPGVAAATLATTVLTAAVFLSVVRKNVLWFGVARPTRATLRWFLGLSSWFLAWKLIFELMTASDVLILAGLASVELVTVYVLTKFVADALSVLTATLVQGVTPGIGGIIGAGDLAKAVRVRAEMLSLTWLITTVVGATMLAWNASFVGLWVGEQRYAGSLESLLIIVMVVQFIFVRSDNYVIDVTLRLRNKVLLGAVSTLLSVSFAVVLVGNYDLGVSGLCAGIIAGRTVMSVASPWLVGRALNHPFKRQLRGVARPISVTAALFAAMYFFGDRVETESWPVLVALSALTAVAVALVAVVAGLTVDQRRTLRTRAATVLRSA